MAIERYSSYANVLVTVYLITNWLITNQLNNWTLDIGELGRKRIKLKLILELELN